MQGFHSFFAVHLGGMQDLGLKTTALGHTAEFHMIW